ncbi:unnamed protein product [Microthlaspi erraticum]|uniref:Uncharacterized protein n=1 Tax=Microthlaspi erraticum TaxID=1685480 RepID=A0A6D2K709_9BRAS|nr:unnamed protein product [Microthlaspi erraticum]
MKVFLWKIVQKALPLGDNLLSRGLPDCACCIHCGELETAENLFFQCPFAQKVWSLDPLKSPISPSQENNFTRSLVNAKTMICLPPTGFHLGPIFPWLVWAIWTARNYLVFEDRPFSPENTIHKALSEAKEWQNAQSNIDTTKPHTRNQKPHRIYEDSVTCFTDGAWSLDTGIAGAGWIFLDSLGVELGSGQSAEKFVLSPTMAEALSIRYALNHALENRYTNLILKSDAQDLVLAITAQEPIKEIYGLLFDIHALASLFCSVSFVFVPRSQNSKADLLAKSAKSRLCPVSCPG